jgi:hypothetical protein
VYEVHEHREHHDNGHHNGWRGGPPAQPAGAWRGSPPPAPPHKDKHPPHGSNGWHR